jgi:exonuclease VII small subunit
MNRMTKTQIEKQKGPKKFRLFLLMLNVVFALLIYWFLGFLMDDISQQPGPSLEDIQKNYQNPTWVNEKKTYTKQLANLSSTIDQHHQQQAILETSINSYRDTMNQLLDLQKASIQKGISFSTESQKNLQNVTDLYLNYQKKFQELNNISRALAV